MPLPAIFADDLFEDWNVGNGGEQQHAGSELHDVAAEDAVGRMLVVENGLGNLYESFAKRGMGDVGIGLLAPIDAVEVGNLAMAQPLHLRKYIPHPVSTFMSGLHFLEGLCISAGVVVDASSVLGMDEAQQITLPRFLLKIIVGWFLFTTHLYRNS